MAGENPYITLRNLRKEKDYDYDTQHCFIELIRSVSVPSALRQ